MRHLVRSVATSIFAVALSAAAAVACPMGGYGCKPIGWRAAHWTGYDVAEAVRLGDINSEVLHAVIGKYPYRTYGYNNGTCIAYRVICDEEGRVIGQEPVVTC